MFVLFVSKMSIIVFVYNLVLCFFDLLVFILDWGLFYVFGDLFILLFD